MGEKSHIENQQGSTHRRGAKQMHGWDTRVGHSELRCCRRTRLSSFNVLYVRCSEVPRSGAPRHTPEYHTIEKGIPTETIAAMDATGCLACAIQASDDLLVFAEALLGIVGFEGEIVEELLPSCVPRLATTVRLVRAILRV